MFDRGVVLAAKLPAAQKLAFLQWLELAEQEARYQLSGSWRDLEKLLRAAKTTLTRAVPKWAELGWMSFIESAKGITLILAPRFCGPDRDRYDDDVSQIGPQNDQDQAIHSPELSQIGPHSGTLHDDLSSNTAVPNWATDQVVITDITYYLDKNREISNSNYSDTTLAAQIGPAHAPLTSQTEPLEITVVSQIGTTPELTPELALELWGQYHTVPERPKGGDGLRRWMKRYYFPMADLIAMQRPLADAQAWTEIDEKGRYMADPDSGWRNKAGRGLPTPENLRDTWQIQVDQIARLRWQPEETTPYPGVPMWDTAVEDAVSETVPNRDTVVEPIVEADSPVWDDRHPGCRLAYCFSKKADLDAFADGVHEVNPDLLLVANFYQDGAAELCLRYGPTDADLFAIDEQLWNEPNPAEETLFYQALAYGRSMKQEHQLALVH